MAPIAHWLIRLHEGEDWDGWGDEWMDHVDKVADLRWVDGWMPSPAWLRDHRSRELDGRAFLCEMRKDEIHWLLRRPPSDEQEAAWQRQRKLLEDLDPSFRYAVVWIDKAETPPIGQPPTDPPTDDRRAYILPDFADEPFNPMQSAKPGRWAPSGAPSSLESVFVGKSGMRVPTAWWSA